MEHDEKSLSHYLKGFVQAAIRVDKYEAADSARKVRQNEVFGSTVENPILQQHLNLKAGQLVQSLLVFPLHITAYVITTYVTCISYTTYITHITFLTYVIYDTYTGAPTRSTYTFARLFNRGSLLSRFWLPSRTKLNERKILSSKDTMKLKTQKALCITSMI